MKRIGIFAVLMVMAFMTMAGLHLTFHAGEVDAVVQGDSNFRNRYVGTVSTTPITDINQLNGVTSNVQTQLDAKTTSSLADTKIFVGSAAGTATAQNLEIINDVTGLITNGGLINAAIPSSTVTSAMIVDGAILSADIAIANVQASDMFLNTVTATVVGGQTGIDTIVEAGSILIDTQLIAGFSNDVTLNKSNAVTIGDGTVQWIVNVSSHTTTSRIVNGIFLRP
jgi:hypothetical protein